MGTDKLSFNRIYIADNFTKARGFGLYSDGRLIMVGSVDGLALKEKDVLGKTWKTALAIGYWRVENNKIQIESFSCQDGGIYLEKKGEIKGDTIIFYQNYLYPIGKDIRKEIYVLSNMSFE